ncbi:MAG: phosphoribosylformylglycinamidine cyclo-ligase [Candidatus Rokubacteria bacterium]|nr:phosphoribosylformylglycinamidine cyclo-ligase [Candidatus Rokubacteria bacterium]
MSHSLAGKESMPTNRSLSYDATGVLDNTQLGLGALLRWVNKTAAFRKEGQPGHRVVDVGFFASVVDIGHGLGLALCTDGVGSKVLIAEMLDRYDTIGIDCVAMNVNDAICVGAEPISFLDYIAIESATPRVLEEIAEGLYRGAELAGVAIVGGEISQIPDIIKGHGPGRGLDVVGMCAGIVPLSRIILGREVTPGDIIIGVRSSGIHSNGLTLARRALLDEGKLKADQYVADLGRTVGEELLQPTHIYVRPVVDLVNRQQLPIRGLVNVTSDGFLNLARIDSNVGFHIDDLPEPQPIFDLIQETGAIPAREMYRVFNMGIGFCLIVQDDEVLIKAVKQAFAASGFATHIIGKVVADERKRVFLPKQGLVGEGEEFTDL